MGNKKKLIGSFIYCVGGVVWWDVILKTICLKKKSGNENICYYWLRLTQ